MPGMKSGSGSGPPKSEPTEFKAGEFYMNCRHKLSCKNLEESPQRRCNHMIIKRYKLKSGDYFLSE